MIVSSLMIQSRGLHDIQILGSVIAAMESYLFFGAAVVVAAIL